MFTLEQNMDIWGRVLKKPRMDISDPDLFEEKNIH